MEDRPSKLCETVGALRADLKRFREECGDGAAFIEEKGVLAAPQYR